VVRGLTIPIALGKLILAAMTDVSCCTATTSTN